MSDMTTSASWLALEAHRDAFKTMHIADLFAAEPDRADHMWLTHEGLSLDYSKNRINRETLRLLLAFAKARRLETWRDRMAEGEAINNTEHRAALHMALRDKSGIIGCDKSISDEIRAERARMKVFVEKVLSGQYRVHNDKPVKYVVNIGIGGSHLGPQAALDALGAAYGTGLDIHFVSNVDAHAIEAVLKQVDPETTLFIIASKTFTTLETMANAQKARVWLREKLGDTADMTRHFVALSADMDRVKAFGIVPDATFRMWDFVGGRLSVWSVIGLSLALGIGWQNFERFLDGGHAMDRHFLTAPLAHNMPVIMGLTGIWNGNFLGAKTHAILPYDQRLDRFIDHLQQLDMESNGKCVNREGAPVDYATGPVVWGRAGTNGPHAFYQLIHQGTQLIPADFIAILHPDHGDLAQHRLLLANVLAQTEALMLGRDERDSYADMLAGGMAKDDAAWLARHRRFAGNIPTNTLFLDRLDPFHFGQLLALYEHRIFVQGVLWNINSFDQWGVELGKVLAQAIHKDLIAKEPVTGHDPSTNRLSNLVKAALDRG